jgi:hypothetical protein
VEQQAAGGRISASAEPPLNVLLRRPVLPRSDCSGLVPPTEALDLSNGITIEILAANFCEGGHTP